MTSIPFVCSVDIMGKGAEGSSEFRSFKFVLHLEIERLGEYVRLCFETFLESNSSKKSKKMLDLLLYIDYNHCVSFKSNQFRTSEIDLKE
jgi:hypothetical protein